MANQGLGTRGTAYAAILTFPLLLLAPSTGAAQSSGQEMSDRSISDAVEDELMFEQAVNSIAIDVATAEGVVTLAGVVDNLLAKERAARIAETVKGVRAVVNNIKVQPPVTRSANTIEMDVEAALALDPATESWEIEVEATDGGVITLSGPVDSWQERELAETVAKGVKGVTEVENRIGTIHKIERPDAELKAEIERALRWDVLVDHALIDVGVDEGQVELSGTVGSAAEKRRAMADAFVAGVREVDSSGLTVAQWARNPDLRADKYMNVTDQEIRDAVEDALLYDPRVLLTDVQVESANNVITLRGTVRSLAAKRAASQDARHTVGVARVHNRLKVEPGRPSPDADIAQHIRSALSRDPYVDSYELSVRVLGGIARLSGVVETYFEKSRADDIASRTPGVISVNNNIEVTDFRAPLVYDPYLYGLPPRDYAWYNYQPYYPLMSDAEIERYIESELWWSPYVNSSDIEVDVDNGIATLTGTVNSWTEAEDARQNAYEGGAAWVIDKLNVQAEGA